MASAYLGSVSGTGALLSPLLGGVAEGARRGTPDPIPHTVVGMNEGMVAAMAGPLSLGPGAPHIPGVVYGSAAPADSPGLCWRTERWRAMSFIQYRVNAKA